MSGKTRAISVAALLTSLIPCVVSAEDAWIARAAPDVARSVVTSRGDASLSPQLALQVSIEDPSLTCYTVSTRETVDGKKQKYTVDLSEDHYVNFTFRAPWPGKQYLKSVRPILDNAGMVMARGRLFRERKQIEINPPTRSDARHPEAELLHAWYADSDVLDLTGPVGIAIAEGSVLTLEHHYAFSHPFFATAGNLTAPDGSGFQICVSPEVPRIEVATSLLGVDTFEGSTASSTCTPALSAPIQVLPVTAYTRYHGRTVTLSKLLADGSEAQLFKVDWTDTNPPPVPVAPTTLAPGERLRVTCAYDQAVKSGLTDDLEACELLVLGAPPGALVHAKPATAGFGVYTCID